MKVENKTAKTASSRDANSNQLRKASSQVSLSQKLHGKKSRGSQMSRKSALNATGEFDSSLHHSLRYNIHGFPIEMRTEKTGIQNGQILNQNICKLFNQLFSYILLFNYQSIPAHGLIRMIRPRQSQSFMMCKLTRIWRTIRTRKRKLRT